MANWQCTLDLVDVWSKAQEREITAQSLAKTIANRLGGLKEFNDPYINDKKMELIEEFEGFSEETEVDFDDLDYLLSNMYDWADISLDNKFGGKKVCWVKTF